MWPCRLKTPPGERWLGAPCGPQVQTCCCHTPQQQAQMQCSCPPELQPKLLAGSLPCMAIGYITAAFGIEPEGPEATRDAEQQSITNRESNRRPACPAASIRYTADGLRRRNNVCSAGRWVCNCNRTVRCFRQGRVSGAKLLHMLCQTCVLSPQIGTCMLACCSVVSPMFGRGGCFVSVASDSCACSLVCQLYTLAQEYHTSHTALLGASQRPTAVARRLGC